METESFMCEKASYVDARPTKKGASEAATVMDAVPEGCFDCNICLDFAADPVVTFCGHLFCWPCIYKWLQQGKHSGAAQRAEHSCPVCKAELSEDTLVPLYGRGHSGKGDNQGLQIPRRPVSAHRPDTEEQHSPAPPSIAARHPPSIAARHPPMQHLQDHYYYPYYNASDGGYTTRMVHSVGGGVLGGMALAVMPWVCRNQESAGVYYSSPYHAANYMGSSTRLRRQEIEMERLLQQIWLFLLFCAALCLFLF